MKVNRSRLAILFAASVPLLFVGPAAAQDDHWRTLEFETTEVTGADVTVSPDGRWLIFTMLGHLFRLPVEGGTTEQLTFGPYFNSEPVFSPDGRRVAFVSDRDGSEGNIFVLALGTGEITQLTQERWAERPAWSPDGQAVAFLRFVTEGSLSFPLRGTATAKSTVSQATLSYDPAYNPGLPAVVSRVSASGGVVEAITDGAPLITSVFYLPDGRLAWAVREEARDAPPVAATTRLEAMDAQGRVSTLRMLDGYAAPIIPAPMGQGLYFCGWPPNELLFLSFSDSATTVVGHLTGPKSHPLGFAVGSDNEYLYLGESGGLWKIDLASGARDAIAFTARVRLDVPEPVIPSKVVFPAVGSVAPPRRVLSPRLSPDGRRLVFMAAGYLWEQTLDGGSARRLSEGSAFESAPAFSPDGRLLAFVQAQDGIPAVRVFDFESGQTRTLVRGSAGDYYSDLAWHPNGGRLVLAVGEWPANRVVIVGANRGRRWTQVFNGAAAGNWWSRPHFSGQSLYYSANTTGTAALYRLPFGRPPELVTQLARHLSDGLVSPAGKWLAFRRNSDIWVAPLGTEPVREEHVRRLTGQGGYTFSFTADGSSLIYAVGHRVWRHPLPDGEPEEIPIRLELERPTPPPLLLRRVRVLDLGTGRFGPETSLLIDQGRIRSMNFEQGQQLPRGTAVVDGDGRFAIPGLFDMHTHTQFGPDAERFLAYGVTSVRDAAGRNTRLNAFADRSETSRDAYPRYFFSGDSFFGSSDYSGLAIEDEEDARSAVHRLKASGVHFLKVGTSRALTRAVAEEARTLKLPMAGHWTNAEGMMKTVILGFASLEHYFSRERLYDDMLQMLAVAGTHWDPTLTLAGGFYRILDGRRPPYWDEAALVSIEHAHRRGVKLLAGSDMSPYGLSLHWELENLSQAGLSPLDVLRIATQEAAAAVGAGDDLGTLEVGKLADIVLLDENPLDDIRNTQSIWRTIKGGWVFDPEKLRLVRNSSEREKLP